jgi:peptidoglycan/xylan/chitin deacetylase (PgdA/CDA1 family)
MLISLLNYGYKFKSINDLNIDSKKNDIYITFDDVHKSVYSIAYPILKELNIPFCCFITTNFIDKENYITSDMLIELSDDDLVTIGSHSVSHPLMRQSLDEDLINEFIESSDILSRITHKKTLFFAYPYGSFYAVDRRTIKMISNTDYVLAFSNVGHLLTKKDLIKKHFISRVNINESNYYKYMVKK